MPRNDAQGLRHHHPLCFGRARRLVAAASLAGMVFVLGCSALLDRPERKVSLRERDTEFGHILSDYFELPGHRAIATAGDVSTQFWVVGVVGQAPNERVAKKVSLERCAKERKRRGFKAPCRLFAVGDERMDWLGRPVEEAAE